ncbi:hypothetical protein CY35_02G002400 [Sphagnum magellanicum]|nr:hypothetical protein CY35_02G002400 [Sphagnum magellanicum]
MNVQSLQQHNPAHAGPSDPDNHLHLHEPRAEELWGATAGGGGGGGKVKEGVVGQGQGQQVGGGGASSTGTTTGSSACQECGNQAKKDCSYQRCRTCCKSRGFECTTHLKSTWVPAAKRRERQAAESAAAAAASAGLLLRPKSKRARSLVVANSLTYTSATSPGGGSADLNSAHLSAAPHPSQPTSAKGGLPPEVRAQALFKCVRLMGVEDGENEFAYQATVKIGGHIFKGVLYDQGLDSGQVAAAPSSSLGDLQLGGSRGGMPSSSALIDPASFFAISKSTSGGGSV